MASHTNDTTPTATIERLNPCRRRGRYDGSGGDPGGGSGGDAGGGGGGDAGGGGGGDPSDDLHVPKAFDLIRNGGVQWTATASSEYSSEYALDTYGVN